MSPEDSLYKEIGERLRLARKEKGLTQDQVAAAISLERTSVTNIESGRQRLPLHTLYQYCGLLGVPVAALLPTSHFHVKQDLPMTIGKKTIVVSSSVAQVIGRRFSNEGQSK